MPDVGETTTTYYVGEKRRTGANAGKVVVRTWHDMPLRAARMEAESYNADERERSGWELREVSTEFVVVKATTTYEEVTA